jgi:hypothetical protein
LKDKINELESNSKNERGDLLMDFQKILTRWKNYFCQLLNVQGAGGVRQTKIHTAEPFVPEQLPPRLRSLLEGRKGISFQVLIRFKQGEILHSEIHKLIMLIWNKEELPHRWKESIVVPIHKKGDKTDCRHVIGVNFIQDFIQHSSVWANSLCR